MALIHTQTIRIAVLNLLEASISLTSFFVFPTWFLSTVREDFRGGKINLEKALKLLEKFNIHCNYIHVKYIFKDNDRLKQGRITIEEFRSIYRSIVHREEIMEIFNAYAENRKFLFEKNLDDFLTQEQYRLNMSKSIASEIIEKYEPVEEVKRASQMSFEGFTRFLCSSECLLFSKEFNNVYQDMHHPLNDYFISSSHNTYLISDQLVGPSDIWGYESALVKGCRCLEIDCWDGSQNEPVVYHGYTLTSKLLFKTVIQAIHKYAFITSDYPVVLSLENHCSPPQQEVIADILHSILGDALLSDILDDFLDKLPSPEALKFKILVRNKKIGTLLETHSRKGLDKRGKVEEYEEYEDTDQEEEADKARSSRLAINLTDSLEKETESKTSVGLTLFRKKKVKVALALSDLVIYTKAEKFRSFNYSREYQQFYESNSIDESTARKLSKLKAHDFILHTTKFITRIYPKALRADSSNFNPQEFWNIGCQMVALNFQTPGLPMDLQNGKFLDNGCSGYILKPRFLRDTETEFNPQKTPEDSKPVTLTIKALANLSHLRMGRSLRAVYQRLMREESTSKMNGTKMILATAENGATFSPRWNETFTFIIQVPELALVRFVVESQNIIAENEFLGQYTLPLLCMGKGYRRVPLFSKTGEDLEPASLFVYVWHIR
ncbi:PREDICTED: 1-phosphatidylinositol 4,5-bisphosphate phosphodiesterase zeta-1 [Myotis davidii]|uniref:1-phosphatidylinositol 4,5-bisphosphate phosphodiesterase zeta-1 n=1 Tax=Myotis davidii TaxID=225400 RepID=UPI0003EC2665|nr:PREDICTED: 1-phosphatidylinositol 4,5-bisphosphate phosphodiesterase zeta-1 [Myotis davidii]